MKRQTPKGARKRPIRKFRPGGTTFHTGRCVAIRTAADRLSGLLYQTFEESPVTQNDEDELELVMDALAEVRDAAEAYLSQMESAAAAFCITEDFIRSLSLTPPGRGT